MESCNGEGSFALRPRDAAVFKICDSATSELKQPSLRVIERAGYYDEAMKLTAACGGVRKLQNRLINLLVRKRGDQSRADEPLPSRCCKMSRP
jgi:hypothetical protein